MGNLGPGRQSLKHHIVKSLPDMPIKRFNNDNMVLLHILFIMNSTKSTALWFAKNESKYFSHFWVRACGEDCLPVKEQSKLNVQVNMGIISWDMSILMLSLFNTLPLSPKVIWLALNNHFKKQTERTIISERLIVGNSKVFWTDYSLLMNPMLDNLPNFVFATLRSSQKWKSAKCVNWKRNFGLSRNCCIMWNNIQVDDNW